MGQRSRSVIRRRQREVILSARIDLGYESKSKGRRLSPDQWFDDRGIEELERDVKNVIVGELPSDLLEIYGIEVRVRYITTRYGSMAAFFAVVMTGLGVFASYNDFFESIARVREHCALLLRSNLERKYREEFSVNINLEYPYLPEPTSRLPRRRQKMFDPMPDEMAEFFATTGALPERSQRDGFFWYLLVLNILLLGTVGVLVYGAVAKTYFGG